MVVVSSPFAQTVSLLGDTLYGLPLDPAGGPARVQRITAARAEVARDSSDLKAWLHLARSTAGMGRLRDAVELYSKIAEVHFGEPRVYRERGEILLRLRHFDSAIADLRRAGLLSIGEGIRLEATREADELPPGVSPWTAITTLRYQIDFFLGFALYCKGNYPEAHSVLVEAAKAALTADEVSHAMLWLFFAARRIGDGSDAKSLLDLVRPDWAGYSHQADIQLLLAYKGLFPSDSIQARSRAVQGEERALYSYGIAYYLLLQPARPADAELWLERARSGGDWAALPYLAAEADLARLRGGKRLQVRGDR